MIRPGARNLITDVPGILVGNAEDHRLRSGATVVLADEPAVCAADVRGGAPATRGADAVRPGMLVERADAIVLSGGSAYGLAAADGVMAGLARLGMLAADCVARAVARAVYEAEDLGPLRSYRSVFG